MFSGRTLNSNPSTKAEPIVGVTQLSDQLNKNIHQEYEKEKASIFTLELTQLTEKHLLVERSTL